MFSEFITMDMKFLADENFYNGEKIQNFLDDYHYLTTLIEATPF